jgi:uncharacterized Tic20 family protein
MCTQSCSRNRAGGVQLDAVSSLKGNIMSDPNMQPPVDPAAGSQAGQPQQPQQQPAQPGYAAPAAPGGYAAPGAPLTAENDQLWASLSHFGGILGPIPVLIIWLVLKDRGPRTNVEGKEALNWQITVTIGYVALWILSAIFVFTLFIPLILNLVLLALWVLNVVFSILGGVKVQGGGSYRYPFNFRFIK